jgi:hypothetical protein
MLSEEAKERLRNRTVDVLLEARVEYLKTGANPLTHWDTLQNHLRASARTSASVEEWSTQMARSLRLGAPSATYSAAVMALSEEVDEGAEPATWLGIIDLEWGYLMASCRHMAEQRKAARDV